MTKHIGDFICWIDMIVLEVAQVIGVYGLNVCVHLQFQFKETEMRASRRFMFVRVDVITLSKRTIFFSLGVYPVA